ncbi:MAG: hypothetical protein WDA09_06870 [Bacteriovoracaceae bacterium]
MKKVKAVPLAALMAISIPICSADEKKFFPCLNEQEVSIEIEFRGEETITNECVTIDLNEIEDEEIIRHLKNTGWTFQ